jgi:hypothetical protein
VSAFGLEDKASAGAWPMEKGAAQSITTFSVDSANRAFDENGHSGRPADFEKIESSAFLEWGVTSRLTLILEPVVQKVTSDTPDDPAVEEAEGMASSQLGARWLIGRPWGGVLSVQGALVAPGDAEDTIDKPFGEGGVAAEARLLAGRSWGGEARGAFVDGQVGRRWRFGAEPDETRLDVTLGVRAAPKWMLLAQSFSLWRDRAAPSAELGVDAREPESHKAQLSVVRRINDRYSVQLGGYGSYAGRDVVDEHAVFAALWLRFSQ